MTTSDKFQMVSLVLSSALQYIHYSISLVTSSVDFKIQNNIILIKSDCAVKQVESSENTVLKTFVHQVQGTASKTLLSSLGQLKYKAYIIPSLQGLGSLNHNVAVLWSDPGMDQSQIMAIFFTSLSRPDSNSSVFLSLASVELRDYRCEQDFFLKKTTKSVCG